MTNPKNVTFNKIFTSLKRNIIGIISLFTVSLYSCLFMYFQNVGETNFLDILPIIKLFIKTAIIILLVYLVIFRSFRKQLP